ncbi:MAG: ROK family protein [Verrucomicrobiota bacterium]|nr:ROK family protein [Verrucomicrobiota bacterium]
MNNTLNIVVKNKPELDPNFIPAVLWNRAYQNMVKECPEVEELKIALHRSNGYISSYSTKVLPAENNPNLTTKYVERLIKYLLWMKGGYKVTIAGNPQIAKKIAQIYSPGGDREFDCKIMGEKIYGKKFEVVSCSLADAPETDEGTIELGGNMDGCRIGFDLGGSDRKCAVLQDGKVVFSEEIEWDPYFESDPEYHRKGIKDTLKRAAEKLPRVDSIGGSAAGVYVDNKVRVASLFRGVSEDDFKKYVENIFLELAEEWDVPFVVVNDGEVTALAGSMEMKDTAVLGISMGTSFAAGYVNTDGNITDWLNELAFVPVDYRKDAPLDEWSEDEGCGVQYFSQQAVARLAPIAGIEFDEAMPFPERLIEIQKLMENGDKRATKIYSTIGTYLAYTIAHFSDFYEIRNLLILGRVTSGEGGNIILSKAAEILEDEFPALAKKITFRTPDEKSKRHGQAAAAASLPSLSS